jgi:RNA-directed DNA polymerase
MQLYAGFLLKTTNNKLYLQELIPKLSEFLETKLRLSLHPKKVFIKTLASGVDFLGWVHFTHYRIPRTSTKHRMLNRLQENESKETLTSYLRVT